MSSKIGDKQESIWYAFGEYQGIFDGILRGVFRRCLGNLEGDILDVAYGAVGEAEMG